MVRDGNVLVGVGESKISPLVEREYAIGDIAITKRVGESKISPLVERVSGVDSKVCSRRCW